MRLLASMAALCLSACASPSLIPEALTDPEHADCRSGSTARALGECALKTRAALDAANWKLTCIGDLQGHEGKAGACDAPAED